MKNIEIRGILKILVAGSLIFFLQNKNFAQKNTNASKGKPVTSETPKQWKFLVNEIAVAEKLKNVFSTQLKAAIFLSPDNE